MPYKNKEKQAQAQHEHYLRKKEIFRERIRRKRQEWKKWFYETIQKHSFCIQCGENHPGVLQFHHRDPKTKLTNVSWLVLRLRSKEKILAEVAKCDCLCANCHAKLHWQEYEDKKAPEYKIRLA